MPNVLHGKHFIEHWIDRVDWLAAADFGQAFTCFWLWKQLWLLYGVLSVCQYVQRFGKKRLQCALRCGAVYSTSVLAPAERSGTPAELTAAGEKNFFLQRLIDKEYVSFRELVSLNGVCEWARAQSTCVQRTHQDSGACRSSIIAAKSSHFSFYVLVLWPQGLDLKFVIDLIITGRFPLEFN